MAGISDLNRLLAELSPELDGEAYVFLSYPHGMALPKLKVLCRFEESEGSTIICTRSEGSLVGAKPDAIFRRITLKVPSSLLAVGLLAKVSSALADAGIPCNVVSAYHHDHLFVPESKAEAALAALQALSRIKS